MKVKEITVNVGLTINLGNYESARLDYAYGITVDEDESVTDVRQLTLEHLKAQVAKDIKGIRP